MKQAVPPQGQARNDFDICADIADALGVRDRFTEQRDANAWLRHLYDRWRTDCAKLGVAVPDFATFWADGSVEVPMPEAYFVPYADFARDPAAHRLNTPTGRIETVLGDDRRLRLRRLSRPSGLDSAARIPRFAARAALIRCIC